MDMLDGDENLIFKLNNNKAIIKIENHQRCNKNTRHSNNFCYFLAQKVGTYRTIGTGTVPIKFNLEILHPDADGRLKSERLPT